VAETQGALPRIGMVRTIMLNHCTGGDPGLVAGGPIPYPDEFPG
jgi:hypothetical protein